MLADKAPRSNSTSSDAVLNVYLSNNPSEILRCLTILVPLSERIQELLEEFPENDVLNQLIDQINGFEQLPMDIPQIEFAVSLESVLVQADEWQKLADREHSIREQMLPLQDVLLEWRQLEVLCWTKIIERIEDDTFQMTVLCGWPIIQVAIEESEQEEFERSTPPKAFFMLVDWLNNSSTLDFTARLWTGRLLAKIIRVVRGDCDFVLKVDRVVLHYEQFDEEVRKLFTDVRASTAKELSDFVKISQYNDLNIWSLKQSAQKAHLQLFRILKNFKVLYFF
jgi:midasin